MKKLDLFTILTVFSVIICSAVPASAAVTDSEYMYYQTYSSLTGLELDTIPQTAYGTTMYDYAVENGVDFAAVKPQGVSSSSYSTYLNGLEASYIGPAIMQIVDEQGRRQDVAALGSIMEEMTGIQSDYWQQTFWNTLLNNEGYNTGLAGQPSYVVDYGSGLITVNFAGYLLNNQSEFRPFDGDYLPEPFLMRSIGRYQYLPTYTPDISTAKTPVFIGNAGGVSVYSPTASFIGNGYISNINVIRSSSVNAFNQRYLRVEVEFSDTNGTPGLAGTYWDIAIPADSQIGDVNISYDGIDSNLIGYWKRDNSGDQPDEWVPITPSDIIVNDWELLPNGYINVDGDILPIYVDFDFDPVISAAINWCNNFAVSIGDDPYLPQYDDDYDTATDIIRDTAKERDKHLKKIEQLLTKLLGKDCPCPPWLKKIYEKLCDIYDFMIAVPQYAQLSTTIYDTLGQRSADLVDAFNAIDTGGG